MQGSLHFAASLSVLAALLALGAADLPPVRQETSCMNGRVGLGLDSPKVMKANVPPSKEGSELVEKSREAIRAILRGRDDRLVVVVGPCSLHDLTASKDYATRLAAVAKRLDKELLIVMRTYFEKPRTVVGWKGLINDPKLDSSHAVDIGIPLARSILKEILDLGVPCATEFLCPITAHYLADLVSYGSIGARTCESQVHRELASYLPMPIGFKNPTSGDVQTAVDGCVAASMPHVFVTLAEAGGLVAVQSSGNMDPHVVLRGGRSGPNFSKESTEAAVKLLQDAGASQPSLVVDCSHGNSGKKFEQQIVVAADLARQVSEGAPHICGVMIESFIEEGAFKPTDPKSKPLYGQSLTDECLGWDTTEKLLDSLAAAVRTRRKLFERRAREAEVQLEEAQKAARDAAAQKAAQRSAQINRKA